MNWDEPEQIDKTYIHIYNKAILDELNNELAKYMPYYPTGQPIPLLHNDKNFYFIDENNFDILWSRVVSNVYETSTHLAGIIVD